MLVLAVGLMTLLAYLKISITPMLTALGVGGLAPAHEAAPDRVAVIAREEASQVEGLDQTFTLMVLCDPDVLAAHLQLKLLVRAAGQAQRGRILSEIRLRLLRRLPREGIPRPGPEPARCWAERLRD